MSAEIANKYAEKWTRNKTMDRLLFIQVQADKPEVLYLGHALMLAGVYTDLWRYWWDKWEEDLEIIELMSFIRQIFEVRIYTAAVKKETHSGVAMFALKHHYGWAARKTKDEIELEEKDKEIANLKKELRDTRGALYRAESSKPKPPKPIEVKPSINAGRFHIETTGHEGGEFIITDYHRKVEVQRIPHTSARQYIDLGDPEGGHHTIHLIGPGFMIEGSFCVEDRRERHRIPEVTPD